MRINLGAQRLSVVLFSFHGLQYVSAVIAVVLSFIQSRLAKTRQDDAAEEDEEDPDLWRESKRHAL
jgi:hypothetical protein